VIHPITPSVLRLFHRFRSAPRSPGILRAPGRPVQLSDLLGRPPIDLDTPELQRFLAGKRILVTGAGGSIGSEICRQAMRFCPERLIMLERAENALFEIDRELRHNWVGSDVLPAIGDVCDSARVRQVFQSERPHVVFHCAAHKHVPMMEAHPCEAIKNNVFGTKAVADASSETGVAAFVLVSSDKAVNPTSVMGATKRFAELYVQSLNDETQGKADAGTRRHGDAETAETEEQSDEIRIPLSLPASPRLRVSASFSASPRVAASTRFLAVRFGNVLGSSGSVVPIFQKQIEAGGPVTVTHPEMKRYFMTIPEASQLVMQAGAIGQGGEIFVLDMGAQVRIVDLATELIRRNGLRPQEDIEIRFTGIRPGEKLYEELACDDEQTCPTAHAKIRVWQLPTADDQEVERGLEMLGRAAETGNTQSAVAALAHCVPEYRPSLKLKTSAPDLARPGPALRLGEPRTEAA
jgi:FlaA1/EpsC-like NDP-sugar epimerase